MAKDIVSTHNFTAGAGITGLQPSTAAGQPVVHEQLTSAIEGISWKDAVRVAASTNVNVAAPGATIDGITMVSGDRFLLRGQTSNIQNGIYIWTGAATPATRAADASTGPELEGARVTVEEGTDAGTDWRQTQINFTIDSGAVIFTTAGASAPAASEATAGVAELATQAEVDTGTDDLRIITPLKLATASNRKRKAVGTVGDASATTFAITHNFNTRDVQVEVYRNSGNYDSVLCDVHRSSVNVVNLTFATAPTSAQFAYVILA